VNDVTRPFLAPACLLAILAAAGASAQTQRSGGTSGGNAQIMQQYQQLSAERVALQTENARLKQDAEGAQRELKAVKKERDELKARSGHSTAELEQAQARAQASEQLVEKGRKSLEELVARFRETATTLRTVEAERGQLQERLAAAGRAFDTCATRNAALYDVSAEVLDRWEHEGAWSRAARAEPFLRLKRTEIENLADEYRERARQLKVKQAPPAAASVAPQN
jgi:chromosome segregation ATPase